MFAFAQQHTSPLFFMRHLRKQQTIALKHVKGDHLNPYRMIQNVARGPPRAYKRHYLTITFGVILP